MHLRQKFVAHLLAPFRLQETPDVQALQRRERETFRLPLVPTARDLHHAVREPEVAPPLVARFDQPEKNFRPHFPK